MSATKDQTDQIGRLFADLGADGPGYAVGVMLDGETIFTSGYGSADLEQRAPITPASRFYMGSVSKQFVAMSALMLAAERKIDLSETIAAAFPELPSWAETTTLYHLLTHTSGVRDFYALGGLEGFDPETVYTEHLVLRMLARQANSNFAPGSAWLYSNSGYLLLAMFVHRVSGQRLDDYARDRIFTPLGMAATRFQHDHSALVPDKAHGYQGRAGAWRLRDSTVDVVGGGGMYSCIDDMLAWMRNLGSGEVGAAEIAAMREPARLAGGAPVPSYGMGFQLLTHAGRPTVEHSGGLAGYRTQLLWIPGERLAVVVLGNSTAAMPKPLAKRIASITLGVDEAPPAPSPAARGAPEPGDPQQLTREARDAFVGIYESAELLTPYRIVPRGDGLALQVGDRPAMTLRPTGRPDALQLGRTGPVIIFEQVDGVTTFGIGVTRAKGLKLKRVQSAH